MAKGLHKNITIIFFIIISLFNSKLLIKASEIDSYKRIEELSLTDKDSERNRLIKSFLKQYPRSKYVPDIRLIIAENSSEPEEALRRYQVIIDKYRYYRKRDYAQYKVCEILYLMSSFEKLRKESLRALELFKGSSYQIEFKFFLIKAYIALDRYPEAQKVCEYITRKNHDYKNLSEAILILAYIDKNTTGLSRQYIKRLREMLIGFKNAEIIPSATYLLGRFYEEKGVYNKAFSAYRDIIDKFPKSPVAIYSRRGLARVQKFNPVITDYIPGESIINESHSIDISPEYEIKDGKNQDNFFYSISLGPFIKKKHALEIKKVVKKDFSFIKIIKLRNYFVIYVGHEKRLESAQTLKIRLAEEYGLNGKIVKNIKKSDKQYIYGD